MLIEEQIKIARLIASGTPREVAITEVSVIDKKSIVKGSDQKNSEDGFSIKSEEEEDDNGLLDQVL